MTKAPKVSIGLAVRNGEEYMTSAIDSILAQSFEDFELIISDNASTDRTEEIARDFAARDGRVRYHRNATNIGGANNENQTVTMARGQYFRWAAHDDRLAPEMLAKSVAVLESAPEVVLCYSDVVEIDADDNQLRVTQHTKGTAARPSQRFRQLIFRDHYCEMFYGLLRTDVLRQTRLQQNYTDSDRVLLAEMALRGRFHVIDEPLFYKRYHAKNQYVSWRSRMAWFRPELKGKIVFPNWMQLGDYFVTINRVPMPATERLRCYGVMGRWLVAYGRELVKDVAVAAVMLTRSQEWRLRRAVTNWE